MAFTSQTTITGSHLVGIGDVGVGFVAITALQVLIGFDKLLQTIPLGGDNWQNEPMRPPPRLGDGR
jgi:hypothetical protein